uniref:Piwi domain-containing protein n=1 Tax=Megaselia scalaris TaxID=36166 RepID=T1GQW9_MEGSC
MSEILNNRPVITWGIIVINDDRNSSYLRAIDEVANNDPQMIFFLVPNNNAERYGTIKKRTCVDRAIPTQVVTSKTANNQRGLMSVATKVAIQINCKLGCAAWMIDLPLNGLMTIGFDIVKSSRDKSMAYGGLVATMDMKINGGGACRPVHACDVEFTKIG